MGIGSIPDAVLSELKGHKRLGIHTEMFSDGVIDLVERGVITNEEKKVSFRIHVLDSISIFFRHGFPFRI